ncbi:MAG: ZIP family metal transporter [Candidatus Omnitrophota bacterium]
MAVWFYSLVSVLIVSFISLAGVLTLAVNQARLNKILIFLVSFAVGALFGDVFIHILPEAFREAESPLVISFGVIGGILLFFILEKFIYWRHCHSGVCDLHNQPVVWLNLVGDGIHNFIDGIIIAASYSVSFGIGIATTLAVILHEIPQEIGDYAILVNGGLSRWKALALNFLCALLSVLGACLALLIGSHIRHFSSYALPLTAGGFIYLAGSDLIPELHREVRFSRSMLQLLSIVMGVVVMALLLAVD